MSPKELNRVDVIRDISERRLRQKDAAELLKLSRRHIQRLVNQYRGQGPAGLVSLRRGKRLCCNTLSPLSFDMTRRLGSYLASQVE
ncbi:helix-turn-helix domain-containing protein [Photobacterium carnosum]|uniref:helix-turn-helix domain-containing protein n=1 Tax=Photobacterium carnosum TaxID=2023717 RepID=UPI001E60DEAE|nr:helix-turn-helix domain-containing protein [Photobacterium carnosum]